MTHCEAILNLLQANKNKWVELPAINWATHKHCNSQCYVVHSRISDLRKRGHTIENKTVNVGQSKQSYYKLVV